MPNIQEVYADIATDFSANPFTGDINMVYNEEAVKQSVKNLVRTMFYERVGYPMVGTSLDTSLFDPNDAISVSNLKNSISEVIDNYEPRAAIQNISVTTALDGVAITVYFIIKLTQKLAQVNISIKRYR